MHKYLVNRNRQVKHCRQPALEVDFHQTCSTCPSESSRCCTTVLSESSLHLDLFYAGLLHEHVLYIRGYLSTGRYEDKDDEDDEMGYLYTGLCDTRVLTRTMLEDWETRRRQRHW